MQVDSKKNVLMRLKFTKGNEVKYISHLDLMRAFQRAIRRADIPIAYSSGFNPHQEISFGAPLSLGITSDAEYLDIKLREDMKPEAIIEELNDKLPAGIKLRAGTILNERAKSAMGLVTHSRYTVKVNVQGIELNQFREKLDEFMSLAEIKVMKKQPKKDFELKEIDIRPMIVSVGAVEAPDSGGSYFLQCLLLSGSKNNLKPELLIKAFADFSSWELTGVRINREEVYTEYQGQLLDLLQYAEKENQ